MANRTLYLMRHAKAVEIHPGGRDIDRPLAPRGHRQSEAAGRWLAARPAPFQVALVSPSVRTRQTYADLGPGLPATDAPGVWNGGPDDIAAEIAGVAAAVTALLVLGHAPGIPALADLLTDREQSDHDLAEKLDRHFPTAAIAALEVTGPWADLQAGRLTALWVQH